MPLLRIESDTDAVIVTLPAGASLLDGLRKAGLPHAEAPCGGKGLCGRCLVEVEGDVSPISERERRLLPVGDCRRLACLARAEGECTIRLHVGGLSVLSEGSLCDFPADRKESGLGAAVDIGTTTVVLYLYDLNSGERLAVSSQGNCQRAYGADVISRIEFVQAGEGGLKILTSVIRKQLCEMLGEALQSAGRPAGELKKWVIAGNTVMLHLLTGLDPTPIARAPFTPQSLFGVDLPAEQLGLVAAPWSDVLLMPCVSGYVGGDIVSGLMSIGAAQVREPVLFVDIGTNGEMALAGANGILCCSTAAGPAFEGANLSCGMAASDGAIDQVWEEDGRLCCSVIGGGEPRGLCGSGLLDAMAVMLRLGIVDETGRMASSGELGGAWAGCLRGEGNDVRFFLAPNVWVSAGDVRKLQLAKAAIRAGIEILLRHARLSPGDLSAFNLAGGFGSFLRPASAAEIGLFPKELLPILKVAGNSAGAGACAALVSASARKAMKETALRCDYLELSGRSDFSQAYLDAMVFE